MNSISFAMLNDHKELNALLTRALEGFGMDKQEQKRLFDLFAQKLEKHFVVEEQAIFSFSHLGDEITQKTIRNLLSEHGEARRLLAVIKDGFEDDPSPALERFQELMRQHQNQENDFLYPKLDQDLKEAEKEYILAKIKSFR